MFQIGYFTRENLQMFQLRYFTWENLQYILNLSWLEAYFKKTTNEDQTKIL